MIPTCKHPDHTLPWRFGYKYYKSKAVYHKLTCDHLDSSPTRLESQTIDKVPGDILDFLPDPEEVVEETISAIKE